MYISIHFKLLMEKKLVYKLISIEDPFNYILDAAHMSFLYVSAHSIWESNVGDRTGHDRKQYGSEHKVHENVCLLLHVSINKFL